MVMIRLLYGFTAYEAKKKIKGLGPLIEICHSQFVSIIHVLARENLSFYVIVSTSNGLKLFGIIENISHGCYF